MSFLSSKLGSICHQLLALTLNPSKTIVRSKKNIMKQRYPEHMLRSGRVLHDDFITKDNKEFIDEIIQAQLKETATLNNNVTFEDSPLKGVVQNYGKWSATSQRTGLIAKKIGQYPMWTVDGTKFRCTLLQIADNHVIKYTSPEEHNPPLRRRIAPRNKKGCLLVGADTVDPTLITKQYYGLFKNAGVLPKKHICQFFISPEAALTPGTPLLASHFRVGDYIDVRGKTIDRGFQGVMRRWQFKGMPKTHGVTKTHRRPGNIGGGGEKGRVWPGTKMPGHMGNRWRVLRGVKIVRINQKHNVIWVDSIGIPGPVNGLCYLFDTVLPHKKLKTPPPFPTYIKTGEEPEETYDDKIHPFSSPTIIFPE